MSVNFNPDDKKYPITQDSTTSVSSETNQTEGVDESCFTVDSQDLTTTDEVGDVSSFEFQQSDGWSEVQAQKNSKFLFFGNDGYTFKTSSGVEITIENPDDLGDIQIFENKETGEVSVVNGNNVKITSSNENANISVYNSKIQSLNTKKGDDTIKIYDSTIEKLNAGKGNDDVSIYNSDIKSLETGSGNDFLNIDDSTVDNVKTNKDFLWGWFGSSDNTVNIENSDVEKLETGYGDDTVVLNDSGVNDLKTKGGVDSVSSTNTQIAKDDLDKKDLKVEDGNYLKDFDVSKMPEVESDEVITLESGETVSVSDYISLIPQQEVGFETKEEYQQYAIQAISDNLESMKQIFQTQNDSDGVMAKGFDGLKELSGIGISSEDVNKVIAEQEEIINVLTQAMNGESDMTFEEAYEKCTGTKFSTEKIDKYMELSNITSAVSSGCYYDENYADKFEEATGKSVEDINKEFALCQNEVLGKSQALQNLVEDYSESQEGFADKLSSIISTTGMVCVAVGAVVSFIPGGAAVGVPLMTVGKNVAFGGMLVDNAIDLVDYSTDKDGLSGDEVKNLALETGVELVSYTAGRGIGKLTNGLNTLVSSKAAQAGMGKVSTYVLGQGAETVADTALSLTADYAITQGQSLITTGETVAWDDYWSMDRFLGEGQNQLMGILTGWSSSKISAHSQSVIAQAQGKIQAGDVEGAKTYLKQNGLGQYAKGDKFTSLENSVKMTEIMPEFSKKVQEGDIEGAKQYLNDNGLSEYASDKKFNAIVENVKTTAAQKQAVDDAKTMILNGDSNGAREVLEKSGIKVDDDNFKSFSDETLKAQSETKVEAEEGSKTTETDSSATDSKSTSLKIDIQLFAHKPAGQDGVQKINDGIDTAADTSKTYDFSTPESRLKYLQENQSVKKAVDDGKIESYIFDALSKIITEKQATQLDKALKQTSIQNLIQNGMVTFNDFREFAMFNDEQIENFSKLLEMDDVQYLVQNKNLGIDKLTYITEGVTSDDIDRLNTVLKKTNIKNLFRQSDMIFSVSSFTKLNNREVNKIEKLLGKSSFQDLIQCGAIKAQDLPSFSELENFEIRQLDKLLKEDNIQEMATTGKMVASDFLALAESSSTEVKNLSALLENNNVKKLLNENSLYCSDLINVIRVNDEASSKFEKIASNDNFVELCRTGKVCISELEDLVRLKDGEINQLIANLSNHDFYKLAEQNISVINGISALGKFSENSLNEAVKFASDAYNNGYEEINFVNLQNGAGDVVEMIKPVRGKGGYYEISKNLSSNIERRSVTKIFPDNTFSAKNLDSDRYVVVSKNSNDVVVNQFEVIDDLDSGTTEIIYTKASDKLDGAYETTRYNKADYPEGYNIFNGIENNTIVGGEKLSTVTDNPDGSVTYKDTYEFNGCKTDRNYNVLTNENGKKISETYKYKITDENGNEILNVDRSFTKNADGSTTTVINGEEYTVSFNDKKMIYTVEDSSGNAKKVNIAKKCRKETPENTEKLWEFFKECPADMLYVIGKNIGSITLVDEMESGISTGVLASNGDVLTKKPPYSLGIEGNSAILAHELGHSIDCADEIKYSKNPDLIKIYNDEFEVFKKLYPTESDSIIKYFGHSGGSGGGTGLSEFIAETNALLSGYGHQSDSIRLRAQYLVRYFPNTIAKVAELMDS